MFQTENLHKDFLAQIVWKGISKGLERKSERKRLDTDAGTGVSGSHRPLA